MNEKLPGFAEWKNLYQSLIELRNIAPWEWLEEVDIFAVKNPKTNEFGFVSIMGAIGEHYAIAVYLGENALYQFWELQHAEPDSLIQQNILEIPQLQASFEDRNFLHPKDRKLIKKLDLNFRGSQSWPMFRSYRPGFFPWYLNLEEAHFLQHVLDQTIDVSLRVKNDRSLLQPGGDNYYLLRKSVKKGDSLLWQDSTLQISPPKPYQIRFSIDAGLINALKNKSHAKTTLEIDIFMFNKPVEDKGYRPYYPYVLLAMDSDNGMIIGNQLLQPLPNLEKMWEIIPETVAKILTAQKFLPDKILINSDLLYQLLAYLAENFAISIEFTDVLPNIAQARASLMKF